MPDSNRDRLYEDGDHWDGFDSYASGEFGDDEPPVKIPEVEVSHHNKAIIASAVVLGVVGVGAAVVRTKRRNRGE